MVELFGNLLQVALFGLVSFFLFPHDYQLRLEGFHLSLIPSYFFDYVVNTPYQLHL